ncbi:hypothetical protein AXG93_406s1300 [Marchantia polymorpha subsp. ruderalis]|uniref:Uncharacterized protein n=1 Tax=Marchantia polymorpha subsp. ruderalis TaxID=1480154 RepID=A0A176VCS4_MARPO|nr:hypothetical protein AXG93_406s1300 [Marchantia polymorpha subsp. ruderalis]
MDEGIDEEDDVQAKEPPRGTVRGPVRVDVVTVEDQLDRRPAKRQKVADASGEGQRPESRMAETQTSEREKVLQPKISEEQAKELTLIEEILEQVVAQVVGTVVDSSVISSPQPPEDVEQEDHLWVKKMECEVLRLNLAKEKECRAEEECKIEDLYEQIVALKTKQMELWGSIGARTQNQLKAVTQQLEASRMRAEEAEAAFHQMKKEKIDRLLLRMEKCLRGFVMWEVQTSKWLKLDSLGRRLMSKKTNGAVRHKQLVRLVNSFLLYWKSHVRI